MSHGPRWDPSSALAAVAPVLRRAGSRVEIRHYGDSMRPTLPDGSSIRVRCGDSLQPAVGDVVVLRTPVGLVTHRVVYRGRGRRSASYLITRGDASWVPDAPLGTDRLLGVVEEVTIDGSWRDVGRFSLTGSRAAAANVSLAILAAALELHLRVARGAFHMLRGIARVVRLARRTTRADRPAGTAR